MKRLLSISILMLLMLPLCGCIVVRGGYHGTVVDATTNQPLEGVDVYYYMTRETHWGGETSSKIIDTQVEPTNRLGDFTFAKNWMWLMPFVQDIGEERVIVNMTLRPDVMMRSFADAEMADFWTKTDYIEFQNEQYQGVIIEGHKAQGGERVHSGVREISTLPGKFIRYEANQTDLGKVKLPRSGDTGAQPIMSGRELIPTGPAAPAAPLATPIPSFAPAAAAAAPAPAPPVNEVPAGAQAPAPMAP